MGKSHLEGLKFFMFSTLLFVISFFYDSYKATQALRYFLTLLLRLFPVFAIVVLFMFLVNVFVDKSTVKRWFREGVSLRGWVIAIISGIISTGPIYMWYPLLGELKRRGLKSRYIACFLYNRAIKIPLVPFLIYYFGVPITILLTLYMIIFSVLNGLLVEGVLRFLGGDENEDSSS